MSSSPLRRWRAYVSKCNRASLLIVEGYAASTYGDHIASRYDAWYEERRDPAPGVDFLASSATGRRTLESGIGKPSAEPGEAP